MDGNGLESQRVSTPGSIWIAVRSTPHRSAAVSEGPAAASAHAQSRRMIPKRVASPCRCGWCSAHTAPARLEPLPNFVAYATKFGRPTGLCQFLNATETRSRVASRSRSSLNGNHSGHAVLVQHRVLYTLIRMQNRTLRAIIFRNAIRGLLLCDLAAAAAAATVAREPRWVHRFSALPRRLVDPARSFRKALRRESRDAGGSGIEERPRDAGGSQIRAGRQTGLIRARSRRLCL